MFYMKASFLTFILCLPFVDATGQIRDSLPRSEEESGIATKNEMQLSEAWFNTIRADRLNRAPWVNDWVGSALPFSFQFNGVDSGDLSNKWKLDRNELSGLQEMSWRYPATGLRATWQIKRFQDYPAVEWVLTLENLGSKDTPVLENIPPLDLRLNHSGPGTLS
jgi:hypothetical protein